MTAPAVSQPMETSAVRSSSDHVDMSGVSTFPIQYFALVTRMRVSLKNIPTVTVIAEDTVNGTKSGLSAVGIVPSVV